MKFINIWNYVNPAHPLQIFIGGRGTGKTYSALKHLAVDFHGKFILMRRTREEIIMMETTEKHGEGANPFKPINRDWGTNVHIKRINRKIFGIYNCGELDEFIGYAVALSTMASMRGLSFDGCDVLVYDEFIPESHVRKLKNEGWAFLNAIETINRNRELMGVRPITIILLSNSNDIYNEIFKELGIVNTIEKMVVSGKHDYCDNDRMFEVHLLEPSEEFINEKSNTFLSKLTRGSAFNEMAFHNVFSANDFTLVEPKSIQGYHAIASVDNVAYIYANRNDIYVSYSKSKCENYISTVTQDCRLFNSRYGFKLRRLYTLGMLKFQSIELKMLILDLIL